MSALAGSKSQNIQTSGGTKGKTTITFRCTCVQTSISTIFSWNSSMTSLQGAAIYSQNGKILLSNDTQKSFLEKQASYTYETTDALQGGWANMSILSDAYGDASTIISVTR